MHSWSRPLPYSYPGRTTWYPVVSLSARVSENKQVTGGRDDVEMILQQQAIAFLWSVSHEIFEFYRDMSSTQLFFDQIKIYHNFESFNVFRAAEL